MSSKEKHINPELKSQHVGTFFLHYIMIQTAKRLESIQEYYFSRKLEQVRTMHTEDFPVINLGIGSPDLPPAAAVIEAMQRASLMPQAHGYQSYKGHPSLRLAIAAFYHKWYGVSLQPESDILPLMGSKEGITHVTQAFVEHGDLVLVPNPGYPTYAAAANLAGAAVETYSISEATGWKLDLDEIRGKDLRKLKLIWVNFPHMPTGADADLEGLRELLSLARAHDFLVVNDNPYSFILNDRPFSILSMPESEACALELNSLSKSHNMAGWRIGWLAGEADLLKEVLKVRSQQDSGMFLPLQMAAVAALGLEKPWFDQLNTQYERRKMAMMNILDLLGAKAPMTQKGMFVWAKVPDDVAEVETWLDHWLHACKVFITPGFIFGSNGTRFLRVSLCSSEERIAEAHARLMEVSAIMERQVPA